MKAVLLTEDEHRELAKRVNGGEVTLSSARSTARQFFTQVALSDILEVTERSLLAQKTVVIGLLCLSFILLGACLVLLMMQFGWAAIMAAPLAGIFWTVIAGFTTELGSLLLSSLLFLISIVVSYFLPQAFFLPTLVFVTSIYAYRLAHVLAHYFFINLVRDSYLAFDMLFDHLEITDHTSRA